MSDLEFRITYAPCSGLPSNAVESGPDALCSDGRVHVRLRDYRREEVVRGFVGKLTYLASYLFQRCAAGKGIDEFASMDESVRGLSTLVSSAYAEAGKRCRGIKFSRNYRRSDASASPTGSFADGACPLKGGVSYGDLAFFSDALGLMDLETFLLDDSVELSISKRSPADPYRKFELKAERSKSRAKPLEYIPLF